jgi:ferredoxin
LKRSGDWRPGISENFRNARIMRISPILARQRDWTGERGREGVIIPRSGRAVHRMEVFGECLASAVPSSTDTPDASRMEAWHSRAIPRLAGSHGTAPRSGRRRAHGGGATSRPDAGRVRPPPPMAPRRSRGERTDSGKGLVPPTGSGASGRSICTHSVSCTLCVLICPTNALELKARE